MLHEQIREARIQAGLTQVKLAKLAGVPRSQLRKFEEGGNITLSTLRKIVAQLPDLQTLNLGAVEIQPGGVVDQELVRQTAIKMIALGQQLLESVGTWAGTGKTAPPEPGEAPFAAETVEPPADEPAE